MSEKSQRRRRPLLSQVLDPAGVRAISFCKQRLQSNLHLPPFFIRINTGLLGLRIAELWKGAATESASRRALVGQILAYATGAGSACASLEYSVRGTRPFVGSTGQFQRHLQLRGPTLVFRSKVLTSPMQSQFPCCSSSLRLFVHQEAKGCCF